MQLNAYPIRRLHVSYNKLNIPRSSVVLIKALFTTIYDSQHPTIINSIHPHSLCDHKLLLHSQIFNRHTLNSLLVVDGNFRRDLPLLTYICKLSIYNNRKKINNFKLQIIFLYNSVRSTIINVNN